MLQPSKNPVTLLRIHSNDVFWKPLENESLQTTLVSTDTIRLFMVFRCLTGNPYSKVKNLVPIVEIQPNDTFPGATKIVLLNLRSVKDENECETKIVDRTPSSRKSSQISQQTKFGTLFMEIANKKLSALVSFCMKLPNCVFQKHASTLDVAMLARVGGGGWK